MFVARQKCEFGVHWVLFLGYVISTEGLFMDEGKVEAIRSWPTPSSISNTQSFHGLTSFYWRFVPHFSSIMTLITNYMKEDTFVWSPLTAKTFELVKTKLTTAYVLVLPDFTLPFELYCDTIKLGIGEFWVCRQSPWPFIERSLQEHEVVIICMMWSYMRSFRPLSIGGTIYFTESLCYLPIMIPSCIWIVRQRSHHIMQIGSHFYNILRSRLVTNLEG